MCEIRNKKCVYIRGSFKNQKKKNNFTRVDLTQHPDDIAQLRNKD